MYIMYILSVLSNYILFIFYNDVYTCIRVIYIKMKNKYSNGSVDRLIFVLEK